MANKESGISIRLLATITVNFILCILIVVALSKEGMVFSIEKPFIGISSSLRAKASPKNRVVLVDIDQATTERYGKWPWERRKLAHLIDAIARYSPRAIGIDILFPEPSDAENDSALTDSLEKPGNVVLAYLEFHHLFPFNYQRETSRRSHFEIGFLDKVRDRAGTVIGVRPCIRVGERTEKAFPVRLAEKYDARLTRNICDTDLLRINFYGPPNTFPVYSATAVLGGLLPDVLRGKIVILCSNVIPLAPTVVRGSEI